MTEPNATAEQQHADWWAEVKHAYKHGSPDVWSSSDVGIELIRRNKRALAKLERFAEQHPGLIGGSPTQFLWEVRALLKQAKFEAES
jgi:hypothetical protein